MHIEGPGAYRARTSYCGMITYRFELQTLAVGYELRASSRDRPTYARCE
jgi:hypothetical protein